MGVYQFLFWDRIETMNIFAGEEKYMFKKIMVKFVDDKRTNRLIAGKQKPKTKKKRIVKKWLKKYMRSIPDTTGCAVVGYNPTEDGVEIFAVAHPNARPFMEEMNKYNDGKQPVFVFVEDV